MTRSATPLLTPAQVAGMLGVNLARLRDMRIEGTGPAFFQLSPRIVRYQRETVRAWLRRKAH